MLPRSLFEALKVVKGQAICTCWEVLGGVRRPRRTILFPDQSAAEDVGCHLISLRPGALQMALSDYRVGHGKSMY
jgi:hypothetical protein